METRRTTRTLSSDEALRTVTDSWWSYVGAACCAVALREQIASQVARGTGTSRKCGGYELRKRGCDLHPSVIFASQPRSGVSTH